MDVRNSRLLPSKGRTNLPIAVPVRALAATTISHSDRYTARSQEDSITGVKVNRDQSSSRTEATARVNDEISIGNLIIATINTLDSMLNEVEGLVSRASDAGPQSQVVRQLEVQARDLAGEFADRAAFTLPSGQKPFQGDFIRMKADEQFGPNLPVTFPEGLPSPLKTVTSIKFSSAESIQATAREVRQARVSLEGFKHSAEILQANLAGRSKLLAVASENQTAAAAAVVDVDRAGILATSAQSLISKNPSQALDSSLIKPSRAAILLNN